MMKDIFLFSDKLKVLGNSIKFSIAKFSRIFILIFKWNKNIQPIQLSYFREWRFEKSYLVIYFYFKNAVWYQLKNIKRINSLTPIILNLENIKEDKIEFIVYGLWSKEIYLIDTTKNQTLITNNFKTSISKINTIQQISSAMKLKTYKPIFEKKNIDISLNEIETNIYPINLTLNNFNQKEYI